MQVEEEVVNKKKKTYAHLMGDMGIVDGLDDQSSSSDEEGIKALPAR